MADLDVRELQRLLVTLKEHRVSFFRSGELEIRFQGSPMPPEDLIDEDFMESKLPRIPGVPDIYNDPRLWPDGRPEFPGSK